MSQYLFDTDVIIDYLRGDKRAIHFLKTFSDEFHTSAITIAELHAGVKEGEETENLNYFLSLFTIHPVTNKIAEKGGSLRRRWHKSHGMGLADALIAATAEVNNMKLISLNEKHFGMLDNLEVPYKK